MPCWAQIWFYRLKLIIVRFLSSFSMTIFEYYLFKCMEMVRVAGCETHQFVGDAVVAAEQCLPVGAIVLITAHTTLLWLASNEWTTINFGISRWTYFCHIEYGAMNEWMPNADGNRRWAHYYISTNGVDGECAGSCLRQWKVHFSATEPTINSIKLQSNANVMCTWLPDDKITSLFWLSQYWSTYNR